MGIESVFFISACGIICTMIMALVRAAQGPTVFDRILSVNMFGTMTVLFIGVIGFASERPDFLDIALVYALMNFISIIAVLKYSDFSRSPSDEVSDS